MQTLNERERERESHAKNPHASIHIRQTSTENKLNRTKPTSQQTENKSHINLK